ncbi:hypothetical protein BCR33DRAFT_326691 [Rhizoclosmatium globosum]|uniref:Uncharacterized protein n=1 Tax=Rhizoclosmatium globosum TaxID=329046 RepID=A0A1Y2C6G4_9FUNG|nr:hypothetical protein BCR33DRAFT_326691 [Rhizoclosmatium globosum]|eukprot:ORY41875.1 hypothetical protein BCR33DRAFT_326691 [Rhizoclosmatium globosum]
MTLTKLSASNSKDLYSTVELHVEGDSSDDSDYSVETNQSQTAHTMDLNNKEKRSPMKLHNQPKQRETCGDSAQFNFIDGFGSKPYVTTPVKPEAAESELLDFDDFFDDLMASCETALSSFMAACDIFTLIAVWSGLSILDVINPSPLRVDWSTFCIVSVRVLHRSVRGSIFMLVLLLLFFTLSNTLILGIFHLPFGRRILPAFASSASMGT